jgi:hypothetical protein
MKNSSTVTPESFKIQAMDIHYKHRSQTVDDVYQLNQKYLISTIFKQPISIWDAIEKLGFVSDPTDRELYAVSQLTHTLQVIEGMENDGIKDDELYLAGWVHDLGKLLLLTDEDPSNIVCDNFVVEGKEGQGLDNCILNWNHDEWIYMKLKNILSDEMSWLIRYHSINETSCVKYFDQKDRYFADKYLSKFKKYDKGTKSIFNIPKINIDKHRRLIEKLLPEPILL